MCPVCRMEPFQLSLPVSCNGALLLSLRFNFRGTFVTLC